MSYMEDCTEVTDFPQRDLVAKVADMTEQRITTVSVQDARRTFADVLGQVQYGGQPVEITKHGKTAAYLVGPEWFRRAQEALADENGALS